MIRSFSNARWAATSWLKRTPTIYLPLVSARRRPADGSLKRLGHGTELVIDAFPRCANTFATYAFIRSQPRPVDVVHHFHAPAIVRAASSRGIPVLTIIRDPGDTAASYLLYRRSSNVRQALRDYIDYYSAVEDCRQNVTVARFETVVTDFGAVVRALNLRANTSFSPFEHTEDHVREVHAEIEEIARRVAAARKGMVVEYTMPLPESSRALPKQAMKAAMRDDSRAASLLGLADALYRRLERDADA